MAVAPDRVTTAASREGASRSTMRTSCKQQQQENWRGRRDGNMVRLGCRNVYVADMLLLIQCCKVVQAEVFGL
jgi:hypothetical protein